MTYSELTPWDLGLIKNEAIWILNNTKCNNRLEALTTAVFRFFGSNGYKIHLTESFIVEFLSKDTYKKSSDDILESIFSKVGSQYSCDLTRSNSWSKQPKPLDKEYKKSWMIF